jgi:hypothetical protein
MKGRIGVGVRCAAFFAALILVGVSMPGAASASPSLPLFSGSLTFATIHGPTDPEEFSWEVQLGQHQELKEIDDQKAAVYYEDGTPAMTIGAEAAHGADGTSVPTTLAVTDINVVTLTVHHQAGNPAAGGAAFDYPVIAGTGFVVGESSVTVTMPQPSAPPAPSPALCSVPGLVGKSLATSRMRLKRAGCALGKVRGTHGKASKVVKQDLRPGASAPAGSAVGVKLG